MALTTCKECKAQISTTADACPQCGAKQVKTSGCAKVVLIFLGFLVLVSIVGRCGRNASTSDASSSSPSTGTAPIAAPSPAASPPPAPAIGSQWSYSQDADPMGKGSTYGASVVSSNTVSFDFPYNGPQHGELILRTHPRYGKDVILVIERGQFLCRSYEDCQVLIRFDDKNPSTYAAVGPSDGSSNHIFIRGYSKFISSMMSAKRVRISAEIYQEGSPAFEFDVTGFDSEKYKPK